MMSLCAIVDTMELYNIYDQAAISVKEVKLSPDLSSAQLMKKCLNHWLLSAKVEATT
jgi:hypothetical protein